MTGGIADDGRKKKKGDRITQRREKEREKGREVKRIMEDDREDGRRTNGERKPNKEKTNWGMKW